jgi:biofilm PGA synthesis N-glycosyltransferase PgaC
MVSLVIAALNEAETVGAAIDALLPQVPEEAEILVVCPDPATMAVVDEYASQNPAVRHVADPQKGKPTAVNAALKAARGEIVVLSDGDVVVADDALPALLEPFTDGRVGAVSGHPISVSPRDTMLGYWSHLLTDAGAHQMRLRRDSAGQFLVCSGYLMAFRRALVQEVPSDALAEDAVISHVIARQGYDVRYAPEARVFVKYPSTYQDWLRQKVRSAGGYAQDYVRHSPVRMRSAWREVVYGAFKALRYPLTPTEFAWTLLLFLARIHLWLLVLLRVRLLKRPFDILWQRVESTK